VAPEPRARLVVTARPRADVYLDGALVKRAVGEVSLPVKAGAHTVEARGGGRSARRVVQAAAGETVRVPLALPARRPRGVTAPVESAAPEPAPSPPPDPDRMINPFRRKAP
jgi:hypothetical protein